MTHYIRDWRRELETLIGTLFVAVLTGLLFLKRDDTIRGSTARLALLFLFIIRAAFEAMAGLTAFFIERPVFYRYSFVICFLCLLSNFQQTTIWSLLCSIALGDIVVCPRHSNDVGAVCALPRHCLLDGRLASRSRCFLLPLSAVSNHSVRG